MDQQTVSAIDWIVVGLSSTLTLGSLAAGVYAVAYWSSPARPVASEFNYLWRARFFYQFLAALFGLVQFLRLQVLWGPESVMISGGWHPTALCRVYIAIQYGLLEPALLLLCLFACVYSLQTPRPSSSSAAAALPAATMDGSITNTKSAPSGLRGNSGLNSTSAGLPVSTRSGPIAEAVVRQVSLSAQSSTSQSGVVLNPLLSDGDVTAGATGNNSRQQEPSSANSLPPASTSVPAGAANGNLNSAAVASPPPHTEGIRGPRAKGSAGASSRNPNFNIIFFALGFTLPCCAAQLVCALFTRIFDLDYIGVWLFRIMFATYDIREADHCPADANPSNCAWCVFPLMSTLVTAGFATAFLLALWVVTTRTIHAAINKSLIWRVRVLQAIVTISLAVSIACRGVTVLFQPFDLGFELLRLGHVLASLVTLCSVSYLLMLRPVLEARRADVLMRKYAAIPMPALGGYPVKVVALPYQKQSSFQKGKPPLPPAATKALAAVPSKESKNSSVGDGDVEVGTGPHSSSASAKVGRLSPSWNAAGSGSALVPPPLISNPLIAASLQPPRVQGPGGAHQQGGQGSEAAVTSPILLPPPPPPAPQPPPSAPPPAILTATDGSHWSGTSTSAGVGREAAGVVIQPGPRSCAHLHRLQQSSAPSSYLAAWETGATVLLAWQQQADVQHQEPQHLTHREHHPSSSSQPSASNSHPECVCQREAGPSSSTAASGHCLHR